MTDQQETSDTSETLNNPKIDEIQIVKDRLELLKGDINNLYYELDKLGLIVNQIKSDTFFSKITKNLQDQNIVVMLIIFIILIFFILYNKKINQVVYKI